MKCDQIRPPHKCQEGKRAPTLAKTAERLRPLFGGETSFLGSLRHGSHAVGHAIAVAAQCITDVRRAETVVIAVAKSW